MEEITKQYTNGEITIVWQPAKCIHSTKCWKGESGLITVFDPRLRPWIKPDGATTARIIAQIAQCPSGALSYFRNDHTESVKESPEKTIRAEILPNGPLLIHGDLSLTHASGEHTICAEKTAFCRCGGSSRKPYCDGSHRTNGFKG